MNQNSHIYELTVNNICVYRNNDLNVVFHEYLNYYLSDSHLGLLIRKKLYDENKKFPLILENIKFDSIQSKFLSDSGHIYEIQHINYLRQLLINEPNLQTQQVQVIKKPEQIKMPINKPSLPKVKVVTFEKKEEKSEEQKKNNYEEEIDEEKLKELEEMIGKLEELKEQEVERMEKEKEIIANKEMEDRQIKMKERNIKDKRKEINNIFEADRRLYMNFSEIIKEIDKLKENEKNNIVDERRISQLTSAERRARVIFKNNDEFKIPELFIHKYPIFEFMDKENIINHEYAVLPFKQIYYKNYETTTESRKYFGDEVYMFNEEDEQNYENYFNIEQREKINQFSNLISQKIVDIEKIISQKVDQNRDIFKQKSYSKLEEIDEESLNDISTDNDSDTDSESDSYKEDNLLA